MEKRMTKFVVLLLVLSWAIWQIGRELGLVHDFWSLVARVRLIKNDEQKVLLLPSSTIHLEGRVCATANEGPPLMGFSEIPNNYEVEQQSRKL